MIARPIRSVFPKSGGGRTSAGQLPRPTTERRLAMSYDTGAPTSGTRAGRGTVCSVVRYDAAAPTLILLCLLSGCATSLSYPSVEPLRYQTEVEYIEVGGLVAASENVRIPLGPGRSYWFNGTDGSRWASDLPLVPPSTKVVILHQGVGLVATSDSPMVIRHVGGPRVVKRGWYGRIVEQRPGDPGTTEVTIEDGRRFEVRGARDPGAWRLPVEVVLSEDEDRIFPLESGIELEVVREL